MSSRIFYFRAGGVEARKWNRADGGKGKGFVVEQAPPYSAFYSLSKSRLKSKNSLGDISSATHIFNKVDIEGKFCSFFI